MQKWSKNEKRVKEKAKVKEKEDNAMKMIEGGMISDGEERA